MTVPVLVAVTGAREADLVARLDGAGDDVRVVRRCADLVELLAAADSGLARAAVVSADLHRLDLDAVARLLTAGVAIVGVADATDPASADRLRALGVRRVTAPSTPGGALAALVVGAVGALPQDLAAAPFAGPAGQARSGPAGAAGAAVAAPDRRFRYLADPADALHPLPRLPLVLTDPDAPDRSGDVPGRLVAVWGPTGAPGRTTAAVNVAAELAVAGHDTVVADADTYGPSMAQVLALLDDSAGLAAAVRAAAHGALDAERLARTAPVVLPRLRVLTGLTHTSRWPELRGPGLDAVWRTCREIAAWTVVDCGFGLEADEELTFDTAAPRRNAATLSALAAADLVVVVGGADPVGLHRLVRGLADLADVLGPAAPPQVVVANRVRAAAVGPRPERRVRDALARHAGVTRVRLVPDDPAALDAALLAGRTLAEHAPGSPARGALRDLALEVAATAPARAVLS